MTFSHLRLWLTLLLSSAMLTLLSCQKPAAEPDNEPQQTPPTITISDIVTTASTVEFTLTTENASRLQYAITKSGDEVQMIDIFSSKEQTISAKKLAVGADYSITAYAYNRENVASELATASFTTEDQTTYARNMLVMKFTGSWCGNCPTMTAALNAANQTLGDKIHIVALHNETLGVNKQYQSKGGDELTHDYNVTAYPSALVDYRTWCDASATDLIAAYNEGVKFHNATSDIAFTSSVKDGIATIDVEVVVGSSTRYAVGVVVTENNIEIANQPGSDDGFYHHVSRAFVTDVYGDSLGKLAKGESVKRSFECPISEEWAIDELEVVVYVQKEEAVNQFYTNNVKSAPIIGSVDFADAQ